MKKVFFIFLLSALFVLPFAASAQLQTFGPELSLGGMIQVFLNWLWIVFAAIAVVCFLVCGILFLTSQGDPAKLKTARNALLLGVAGVIVGIISYSIIPLVGSLIGT